MNPTTALTKAKLSVCVVFSALKPCIRTSTTIIYATLQIAAPIIPTYFKILINRFSIHYYLVSSISLLIIYLFLSERYIGDTKNSSITVHIAIAIRYGITSSKTV